MRGFTSGQQSIDDLHRLLPALRHRNFTLLGARAGDAGRRWSVAIAGRSMPSPAMP
jgi:hypothetical protein